MAARILQYYNTVKYLRPTQIAGQFAKTFIMNSKPMATHYDGPALRRMQTLVPALDLDARYLSRFSAEEVMNNEITLIGETHALDLASWSVDASPLWRFNLHYFEYAIALAAKYSNTGDISYYNKFKELVISWIAANPAGQGDGWHPYTISMRLPNLFICFDLLEKIFEEDTTFKDITIQSIYTQYRILIKRKEIWQLGNHYFENLKTIIICSLLFNEHEVFNRHINIFLREVSEEILPDGVHFELSIMYHKIILEDILRTASWLRQAGKPQYRELMPVIEKMVSAMASLEKGMGKTPLFNDSGDGVAKECSALLLAANELFGVQPVYSDSFDSSGYHKLYDNNIALMFDAGTIGPSYMPGHGHCDCLSFELSVDNKPLFVNSGTYQYQGKYRNYFRTTRAHNTQMVGDKEQSECWGEHRVARRVSLVKADKSAHSITASCSSFSGDKHTRSVSLKDNILSVMDRTNVKTAATVHSYLHLVMGVSPVVTRGKLRVLCDTGTVCDISMHGCSAAIHTDGELANYAPEFGVLQRGSAIEFSWPSDSSQHGYEVNFNVSDGRERY